jgi:hypothetical protein
MVRATLLAGAVALWAITPVHAEERGGMDTGRQETSGVGEAGTRSAASGTATAVEAAQLAKNPTAHYGKMVQVKADVADVYGTTAFSLDEDTAVSGPDILVIAPRLEKVAAEAPVTVRGTVRKLATTELERDYDWFESSSMDADVLDRFKDRPVIVAESVESSTGQQLVIRSDAKGGTAAGDAPARPKIPGTDYEAPTMPGR